jgi:uncharacterized membrane protein
VPDAAKQRILFLDWIRGFACLLMFQTHGYDSWLGGQARNGEFFRLSQLGGTLPAPLFLFAAGISVALVTERMRQKGLASRQIARTTMVRGLEIFGFAILFRLQEFLLGQPHAPWTDLLRVDILNVIGLSIVLMGFLSWIVALAQDLPAGAAYNRVIRFPLRATFVSLSVASVAAIALATPPLWTTHRLRWLPWYVETYFNGVHNFDQPQPWLFPIFPWTAFAFAGLAFGFLLFSPQARRHEAATFTLSAVAGALLFFLGQWMDGRPLQLYAVYDFWHTSPNFFLMRTGILLGTVFVSYAWCRWGAGQRGFSPVVELGRSSLVVYWVHTEFVYGRFSILAKQTQSIPAATLGILVICAAMVALATLRNRLNGRGPGVLAFWRRPARIPA